MSAISAIGDVTSGRARWQRRQAVSAPQGRALGRSGSLLCSVPAWFGPMFCVAWADLGGGRGVLRSWVRAAAPAWKAVRGGIMRIIAMITGCGDRVAAVRCASRRSPPRCVAWSRPCRPTESVLSARGGRTGSYLNAAGPAVQGTPCIIVRCARCPAAQSTPRRRQTVGPQPTPVITWRPRAIWSTLILATSAWRAWHALAIEVWLRSMDSDEATRSEVSVRTPSAAARRVQCQLCDAPTSAHEVTSY